MLHEHHKISLLVTMNTVCIVYLATAFGYQSLALSLTQYLLAGYIFGLRCQQHMLIELTGALQSQSHAHNNYYDAVIRLYMD